MPSFTDQTGQIIALTGIPKRIVSLVPSQTELLFDLGLEETVVGITKFCIHPSIWFHNKKRIGGTKSIHIDQVKALQPDLIIANKEENLQHEVEDLRTFCPVWISDISKLSQAIDMIESIGKITGTAPAGKDIIDKIETGFASLQASSCHIKTAYLIWQKPYMTVGADTFINDMLTRIGLDNIFSDHPRYPEISISALQERHCDVLLLSSEPFPFNQSHIEAIQPLLPSTKIILADGEMFSWYGSRLVHAPEYFNALLNTISLNAIPKNLKP